MNPYSDLPPTAFWRSGVAEEDPFDISNLYAKKFEIGPKARIAAAGSCFAQRVSQFLKRSGYRVIDAEPAPGRLPTDVAQSFGYGMFSARYGNIYTLVQLLQLLREATGEITPTDADLAWHHPDGGYIDAMRPAVEPQGLPSIADLRESRAAHLEKVRQVFQDMHVLVYTLGLTETWRNDATGLVYPSAPGVFGTPDTPDTYRLWNTTFPDNLNAFKTFHRTVKKLRGGRKLRYVLTVSPVAMTATATGNHILAANTYTKSLLRTVAGHLADTNAYVDYLPSYEIVINQAARSGFYDSNLRTIRPQGVDAAMKLFFDQHPVLADTGPAPDDVSEDDVQCEEAVLEVFNK